MPVTPTKPRDLRPGDVVRLPRMSADLTVETFDDTVRSIEAVTSSRYCLRLDGDGKRYVSAREEIDVIT